MSKVPFVPVFDLLNGSYTKLCYTRMKVPITAV